MALFSPGEISQMILKKNTFFFPVFIYFFSIWLLKIILRGKDRYVIKIKLLNFKNFCVVISYFLLCNFFWLAQIVFPFLPKLSGLKSGFGGFCSFRSVHILHTLHICHILCNYIREDKHKKISFFFSGRTTQRARGGRGGG